jgi:hypothetical protein
MKGGDPSRSELPTTGRVWAGSRPREVRQPAVEDTTLLQLHDLPLDGPALRALVGCLGTAPSVTEPRNSHVRALHAGGVAGLELSGRFRLRMTSESTGGVARAECCSEPSVDGDTIEIAIPWTGLAALARPDGRRLPPKDGDVWRMDFSRFNQYKEAPPAQDPGGWAWSPHGAWDSHIPEVFPYVRFSSKPVGETE